MEKYQIRNVSEREIYDSYMGIMRISPNPLNGSNDRLYDDPTPLLNSLLTVDKLKRTEIQTEIILSDSDGNALPIKFIPKAKYSRVIVCEGDSKYIEDNYPLINITTKIDDKAKLFVSESFNSYSTIYLDNKKENEEINYANTTSKISPLQIVSKNAATENIILYPIESPHDEDYFNDKNKLNLVDYTSGEKYKDQMERNLLKKSSQWYSQFSEILNKDRVTIDGKMVTTFNDDGEVIPVLYTRDYVMGHYEGHTLDVNDNVKTNWIGGKSHAVDRNIKSATKLSWMRFDKLVWDVVSNVLKGDVRHTKGRYKSLGIEENDHISDVLFGKDETRGDFTLFPGVNDDSDFINHSAPLIGHGVQRGLILYNAIPFNRYMFHVARQICANLSHQFNNKNTNEETGVESNDWIVSGDDSKWRVFNKIAQELGTYYLNNMITKAPQGAISSIHSLVKDYLLCDGKEITYRNYPNLNLSNRDIFEIKEGKLLVELEDGEVIFREKEISKLNKALKDSSANEIFETPHLYTILEKSPRLIRALNWEFSDENAFKKAVNMSLSSSNGGNNYVNNIKEKCNSYISINGEEPKKDEEGNISNEIFVGMGTSNVVKDIINVGLYFYNYDSMIKRNDHYHSSFSGEDGLHSTGEVSKNEKEVLTACVSYQTGKKRGGKIYSVDHKTVLNHDYTHNVSGDNSKNWIDYCYNKNTINKYGGYAPIPNAGLFLFNAVLFNSVQGGGTAGEEYRGTSEYIESEISKGNYIYYDGENTAHTVYGMTKKTDMMSDFIKIIYRDGYINEKGEKIRFLRENPWSNKIVEKPEEDATEEEKEKLYWSNFEEESKNSKNYTLDFWNKIYVAINDKTTILQPDEKYGELTDACVVFRKIFSKHIEEKKIRRMQIVKMNEAEGRIPAAAQGGPLYVSWVNWSRTERRNIKKKRRKEYSFRWKGVGNYNIGYNTKVNDEDTKSEYRYRCLTSIPYQNPKKLGVGDVKSDLKDNYFNKNSVTSSLKDIVHEKVSYGGVEIDASEMDLNAPSPNYVNLLPLIRI